MDNSLLVKKAKKGDKEALVELVMDRKIEYYKLAFVYMGNKEDAMDALEDMIVILYEKIPKLKNAEAFYSWSKTILVNCCKKILRSQKKIVIMDEVHGGTYIEDYESKEQYFDIKKHLDKLSEKQREAIKLKYFLDMDYKSISRVMKVPEGTVKSRISIGLKKLKESLGGEY